MDVNKMIPKPKTKFLKVKCRGCENEQTIFSAPSKDVKCNACGKIMGKATGSKIELKAKLVKVLE